MAKGVEGRLADILMGMENRLNLRITNLENNFKSVLQNEIASQIKKVGNQLNETLTQIEQSIDHRIEEEVKEKVVDEGKEEFSVKLLEKEWEINRLEQYSLKWNVRVYGIQEKDNEDCKKEIIQFAESKLGMKQSRKHMDIAHRVCRKVRGKNRAIVVRFFSHEIKTNFIKAKKVILDNSIKDAGISEDLTGLTKRIRDTLRKHNQLYNIEHVWTIDGKIKIKKSGSDRVMEINFVDKLRAIVGNVGEGFQFGSD